MVEFMNMIDFNSSVPYYSQLKKILLGQINRGDLKNGDKLPSQSELCDIYGVSMSVVRQALRELEYEGRIIQRKGKVAYVTGPKISGRLLERVSGTYQDLSELGYYPISKILKQHIVLADTDIAKNLLIEPGAEVIEIERLRFVNEEPFVLVTSYLPLSLCPKIVEINLSQKSLLGVLKSEYGIVITSSKRSIETVIANEHEAKLLQINQGSPLLFFNSVSYMESTVIGTTKALFRGDRARFEVELVSIDDN